MMENVPRRTLALLLIISPPHIQQSLAAYKKSDATALQNWTLLQRWQQSGMHRSYHTQQVMA